MCPPALTPAQTAAQKAAADATTAAAQKSKADKAALKASVVIDTNLGMYCDVRGKRTLGEKEQEFLMALQSFYEKGAHKGAAAARRASATAPQRGAHRLRSGKAEMSNEEFDNLKQELLWEGSKVAILNKQESRFLQACISYNSGNPVMPDGEYDALKRQLLDEGSIVAASGPRCSLRSQRVFSDALPDYPLMTALNVPGALLGLGLCYVIDAATGYSVSAFVELPEPYGIVAVWGVVLPAIYAVSAAVSRALFPGSLVLKGPCPECGTPNRAFFGTLLTVEGDKYFSDAACTNCKAPLVFERNARAISVVKQ